MRYFALISAISIIGCVSKPDASVFRWRMDYDIEHGRSVDAMWLGKATMYSRREIEQWNEGTVWRFKHATNGCEFEYVTDSEGKGVAYRFISPEGLCVPENKFSGW